jgi:hypothetical protein
MEALIAEARRARSQALCTLVRDGLQRTRDNLYALFAPAWGINRRHLDRA